MFACLFWTNLQPLRSYNISKFSAVEYSIKYSYIHEHRFFSTRTRVQLKTAIFVLYSDFFEGTHTRRLSTRLITVQLNHQLSTNKFEGQTRD